MWFAVATCLWHVLRDAPQGRVYNSSLRWNARSTCAKGRRCHCRSTLNKPFRENWSRQTLGDDKRIVPECFKQFLKDLWLSSVAGHALHLGLQLVSSNGPACIVTCPKLLHRCRRVRSIAGRPLPIILQRLRFAQILFHLPLKQAL